MSSPSDDGVVQIVRWKDGVRVRLPNGYAIEFESPLDALKVAIELADASRDILAALDYERKEAAR